MGITSKELWEKISQDKYEEEYYYCDSCYDYTSTLIFPGDICRKCGKRMRKLNVDCNRMRDTEYREKVLYEAFLSSDRYLCLKETIDRIKNGINDASVSDYQSIYNELFSKGLPSNIAQLYDAQKNVFVNLLDSYIKTHLIKLTEQERTGLIQLSKKMDRDDWTFMLSDDIENYKKQFSAKAHALADELLEKHRERKRLEAIEEREKRKNYVPPYDNPAVVEGIEKAAKIREERRERERQLEEARKQERKRQEELNAPHVNGDYFRADYNNRCDNYPNGCPYCVVGRGSTPKHTCIIYCGEVKFGEG